MLSQPTRVYGAAPTAPVMPGRPTMPQRPGLGMGQPMHGGFGQPQMPGMQPQRGIMSLMMPGYPPQR